METEKIVLSNGQKMPALGFGTWQASREELEKAVEEALSAGYRHIDAAAAYENEDAIGKVLKEWIDQGKIKRSELFVVSKLPPTGNRPEGVEKWIKRSLANLQLDYLDLYLVHTPFSFQVVGEDLHPRNENGEMMIDKSTNHVEVWKEMERQVKEGRTRAIGLSNFNQRQITRIIDNATVPVACLQVELHLYFQQAELLEFCERNDIAVTAYAPLGSRGLVKLLDKTDKYPDLLENPTVLEIAKRYDKKPAQILLRHILQKGCAAIPKSTNQTRIRENIDLFRWKLTEQDFETLNRLDWGESGRICDFSFFTGVDNHPEFPF